MYIYIYYCLLFSRSTKGYASCNYKFERGCSCTYTPTSVDEQARNHDSSSSESTISE